MKKYKKAYKRTEDGLEEILINGEAVSLIKDLNKMCRCAYCNEPTKYGDTYSSSLIVDERMVGYAICKGCKEIERDAKMRYYRSKGF